MLFRSNDTYPNVIPLLVVGEDYRDLLKDCTEFCAAPSGPLAAAEYIERLQFRTRFMHMVAGPLAAAYLRRKAGQPYSVERIAYCDWLVAFHDWCYRRDDRWDLQMPLPFTS